MVPAGNVAKFFGKLNRKIASLEKRIEKLEFELTNHQHVFTTESGPGKTEMVIVYEQDLLVDSGIPDPDPFNTLNYDGVELFSVDAVQIKQRKTKQLRKNQKTQQQRKGKKK